MNQCEDEFGGKSTELDYNLQEGQPWLPTTQHASARRHLHAPTINHGNGHGWPNPGLVNHTLVPLALLLVLALMIRHALPWPWKVEAVLCNARANGDHAAAQRSLDYYFDTLQVPIQQRPGNTRQFMKDALHAFTQHGCVEHTHTGGTMCWPLGPPSM